LVQTSTRIYLRSFSSGGTTKIFLTFSKLETPTHGPALHVFRHVKDKYQNVQLEARFYAPECLSDDRLTNEDIKGTPWKKTFNPQYFLPQPSLPPAPNRHHSSGLRQATLSNRCVRAPRNTGSDSSRPAEFGRNSVRVQAGD